MALTSRRRSRGALLPGLATRDRCAHALTWHVRACSYNFLTARRRGDPPPLWYWRVLRATSLEEAAAAAGTSPEDDALQAGFSAMVARNFGAGLLLGALRALLLLGAASAAAASLKNRVAQQGWGFMRASRRSSMRWRSRRRRRRSCEAAAGLGAAGTVRRARRCEVSSRHACCPQHVSAARGASTARCCCPCATPCSDGQWQRRVH